MYVFRQRGLLSAASRLFYIIDWVRTVFRKGPTDTNTIALSFDDGPHGTNTLKVLEVLHEYNARATFFWIAQHATELYEYDRSTFTNVVNAIKANGHEIGLHGPDVIPTITSRLMGTFSKEAMRKDKQTIEQLTGMTVTLFRPHYFQLGPAVRFARELGMTTILGSVTAYATPTESIQSQIHKFIKARPGAVVIFHDGITLIRHHTRIIETLPHVLGALLKKGYHLTTVSKLFDTN